MYKFECIHGLQKCKSFYNISGEWALNRHFRPISVIDCWLFRVLSEHEAVYIFMVDEVLTLQHSLSLISDILSDWPSMYMSWMRDPGPLWSWHSVRRRRMGENQGQRSKMLWSESFRLVKFPCCIRRTTAVRGRTKTKHICDKVGHGRYFHVKDNILDWNGWCGG